MSEIQIHPNVSSSSSSSSNSSNNNSKNTSPIHSFEMNKLKSSNKLFVGGLSWTTTDESFHGFFSQFGLIEECMIIKDREKNNTSRGFGFVRFSNTNNIDQILNTLITLSNKNELELDGRKIECKIAVPKENMAYFKNHPAERPSRKMFVGGLSPITTSSDLANYFSRFGRVQESYVMKDLSTGKSRGFGFVTFDSESPVELILQAPYPHIIRDKQVDCKKAVPRKEMINKIDQEVNPNGGHITVKNGKNSPVSAYLSHFQINNNINHNNNNTNMLISSPNSYRNYKGNSGSNSPNRKKRDGDNPINYAPNGLFYPHPVPYGFNGNNSGFIYPFALVNVSTGDQIPVFCAYPPLNMNQNVDDMIHNMNNLNIGNNMNNNSNNHYNQNNDNRYNNNNNNNNINNNYHNQINNHQFINQNNPKHSYNSNPNNFNNNDYINNKNSSTTALAYGSNQQIHNKYNNHNNNVNNNNNPQMRFSSDVSSSSSSSSTSPSSASSPTYINYQQKYDIRN